MMSPWKQVKVPAPLQEQLPSERSDTPTAAWLEHSKEVPDDNDNMGGSSSGSSDLLKEVLSHQDQPSSPKRPHSPLRKKFNKVAPLDVSNKNTDSKPSLESPLMATSTATNGIKLDTYEPQIGSSTVITNTSAVTDNASVSETEPLKTKNEPVYSAIVKVKPSHHQFDSSNIGTLTPTNTNLISEDHQGYSLPVIDHDEVNHQHSVKPKLESEVVTSPSVDETDSHIIPEEPEIPMSTHDPKTYNQKPPPKEAIQLISIKPVSDTAVVPDHSFPVGSSYDMQPIHYMASTGDQKKLAQLISELNPDGDDQARVRGSIDVRDSEGRTPLMHAIHNEHFTCVKMLIDAGADIDIVSNDGSTPLHHVSYNGSYEMLALLLSLGADGMIPDNNGRYPLHWVTNNSDPRCTQLLLDKVAGLDVNVRDSSLMTPLMWAAFHARPEHIQVLKQNGADTTLADIDGMCAIHWAIHKHETGTLKELISIEATKYQDNKGRTVMHVAADEGCAKEVNIIRSIRPTSVQDFDKQGHTPLHWAVVCDNPDVIKALLVAEANPNIKDVTNRTPLDYAMEKQLNYCALLLSNAQQSGEVGTDQGQFTFTSAQQQGQSPVAINTSEQSLSEARATLLKNLSVGCWMYKFTEDGKGPMHKRFFTVLIDKQKLCWAKSAEPADKDIKSDKLLNVRSSVSPLVQGRKDFDPVVKHRYAFTILTTHHVINVVALSSEDYKIWVNGLQFLLEIGPEQAVQLATQH
ncbi:ankyrin repeat, PH and SEC7 domain containing protein secG-like [Dysidea avara]|uniref:ankyrin repeat, PH and SEC7 domain containing protein secG-like n=1 Tax=Dysidea avara TaxID=196820 RepID=UPI003327D165